MARQLLIGFESGSAAGGGFSGTFATGTPTFDTEVVRSGLRSLRCKAAQRYQATNTGTAGGNEVPAWMRAYVYFRSFPNSATDRVVLQRDSSIRINNTGTLALYNHNTQVGSRSAALELEKWYCLELYSLVNASAGTEDQAEARLDQSQSATELSLTGTGQLLLDPAEGQSTTALGISAQTFLPVMVAAGQSETSFTLSTPALVELQPAEGQSTTALSVIPPSQLGLLLAEGVSTTTLGSSRAAELIVSAHAAVNLKVEASPRG